MIRGGFRDGLVGGALAALSLAIGLEGLPSVAARRPVPRGRLVPARPSRRCRCWRASASPSGAPRRSCSPPQTAPGLWARPRCDALSPPWLWLALGGFAFAVAAVGLAPRLGTVRARAALRDSAAQSCSSPASRSPSRPVSAAPSRTCRRWCGTHWLLTVNEMASVPKFVARGQWEALVFYPVAAAGEPDGDLDGVARSGAARVVGHGAVPVAGPDPRRLSSSAASTSPPASCRSWRAR